jgi:hypothetical protein
MLSTTRFYGGNYADQTFLKLHQITILKADDYSSVFIENIPTQSRMYFLSYVTDNTLLLVNKKEWQQIGQINFNSTKEDEYAVKQMMGLKLAQVVVTNYTQPTDNVFDRDEVIMDIREYSIEAIKKAGATSATCRYYVDLVEWALLGSTPRKGIYTANGFVISEENFVSTWRTVINQNKKLTDLDIIKYQNIEKGVVALKFNKKFLNYNQLNAPVFFDSFTY